MASHAEHNEVNPSSSSSAGLRNRSLRTRLTGGVITLLLLAVMLMAGLWVKSWPGGEQKIIALTAERDALLKEVQGLRNDNAQLHISNASLVAEIGLQKLARTRLEHAHQDLAKQHDIVVKHNLRTVDTVKTLSTKLATRTVVGATRNVASMAGEVIPVIGTSVMIAVTALDVKDACETLKDLNNVNQHLGFPQEDETRVCGLRIPNTDELHESVKHNWRSAYAAAAKMVNDGTSRLPTEPAFPSLPYVREWLSPIFGKFLR